MSSLSGRVSEPNGAYQAPSLMWAEWYEVKWGWVKHRRAEQGSDQYGLSHRKTRSTWSSGEMTLTHSRSCVLCLHQSRHRSIALNLDEGNTLEYFWEVFSSKPLNEICQKINNKEKEITHVWSRQVTVFCLLIPNTDRSSIGPSPCFKPSDRLLHAANRLEPGGTRALKLNIPSNDHCLSQANQQKTK